MTHVMGNRKGWDAQTRQALLDKVNPVIFTYERGWSVKADGIRTLIEAFEEAVKILDAAMPLTSVVEVVQPDPNDKVTLHYWRYGAIATEEFDSLEEALRSCAYHCSAGEHIPSHIITAAGAVMTREQIYEWQKIHKGDTRCPIGPRE